MELSKLFGLPAHPLLVHIPVVLAPLAAIGGALVAFRRSWRDRYGWWVVLLAGMAAVGTQLAYGAGEALAESRDQSSTLRDHIAWAKVARPLCFLFFLVIAVFVGGEWWLKRRAARASLGAAAASPRWVRPATIALSVLTLVTAGLSTVWMVGTGHNGAKSVWVERQGREGGEVRPSRSGDDG